MAAPSRRVKSLRLHTHTHTHADINWDLGIFHIETVVEGMEGGRKSHLLHLCGLLLRLVLVPCQVQIDPYPSRSTALSFAAELDGHVLGALCAVTTVQETKWDAEREKACINTYAHASASQICLHEPLRAEAKFSDG